MRENMRTPQRTTPELFRHVRLKAGLTIPEFAKVFNITPDAYRTYESGKVDPQAELYKQLMHIHAWQEDPTRYGRHMAKHRRLYGNKNEHQAG